MKKFIALALSVASLVAAAEMALAPGTMKHKYVAPNDYVTTNAWMTVSNKVDALAIKRAQQYGGGGGSGINTNAVLDIVNDAVGGTNDIAHIESDVSNGRLLSFNLMGKIEDSGIDAYYVPTVDGTTHGGKFLCFSGESNGIVETISTNSVMMKPSYIDIYDDNNWPQMTLFTYNGQYENPRSNWGIFGLNFWDADGLITTYGSSITHGSYTYQFPSWSGTLALQSEVNSKVPSTRKINNKELSSDITLQAGDVDAVPTTRKINNKTLSSDITLQPSDIGAASTQDLEATQEIVYSWENFLDGSNVVFSITNYISGTYNLAAAKLRIMEMTNGVYREVYNSRDEIVMHIDNFKTNDFRVATNAVITSVDSKIGGKADKAWGKYTSAGNEAPSNTVYMTAPNTVFAGGMEYERVAVGEGSVCVLTTKGAPVWTMGDEGTFKFQDDGGTNYFGFAKTDSYVIGCNTDGITTSSGIVTLTYNVTMSGVPCIWYKADLATETPWEQLNLPDGSPVAGASHTVTWDATPPAGSEICYINCSSEAKGFFKATIEVAGSAKFMTNMPADLSGGIICTNTANGVNGIIRPSYNGSSVIWTWSAQ